MNNTQSLPQVITRLAKLTNTDANTVRLFLKAFFATIENALAEGQSVTIKNIGTFRRADDSLTGEPERVVFIPDTVISEELNRPFAMFSPVELADDITAEDLEPQQPAAEEPSQTETPAVAEETADVPEMPAVSITPAPADIPEVPESTAELTQHDEPEKAEVQPESHAIAEPVQEPLQTPVVTPQAVEAEEEPAPSPVYEYPEPQKKSSNRTLIWCIVIVVLACVLGYFAAVWAVPEFSEEDYYEEVAQEEIVEAIPEIDVAEAAVEESPAPAIAESPSPQPVETKPEPKPEQTQATAPQAAPAQTAAPEPAKKPRYDTVTSTRYLATMAREYYGAGIFWVYIYEANADKLGNPNQVKPGTKVIIPEKSTIPSISNRKEAVRLAEKKAAEIQKRYK